MSYKLGALRMMPPDPAKHVRVNRSRNNLHIKKLRNPPKKVNGSPVQHHGNIFPVLHDLIVFVVVPDEFIYMNFGK